MRIKSTFHDFYDCVQGQGQDLSLLYLRQPRVVRLQEPLFPFITKMRHWRRTDLIRTCYVIGFCGKIYSVLGVQNPSVYATPRPLCYTLDEVDAFVQRTFKAKLAERYFTDARRNYWREAWHYTRRSTLDAFFNESLAHRDKYEYIFRDNHCPIFVYRETRDEYVLTYNGCLRDVQFYRCIEPFTAFQEVQMFLGGMAFPNKPIPKVSDKIMAAAKGFDKWSFRKEPKKCTP